MVTGGPGQVERLRRTEAIWRLPALTRDEALALLADTEDGTFVVRGSRQPGTWALTVRTAGEVQHFIVLRGVHHVLLEDSSLTFPDLPSLIAHYSSIREELPCLLRLPSSLTSVESLHALDSFALLGKDFWHYPMSRPGRRSLLLPPTPPCSGEEGSEGEAYSTTSTSTSSEGSAAASSRRDLAKLSARLTLQLEELSQLPVTPPPRSSSISSSTSSPTSSSPTTTPPRVPRRSVGRVDTPTTSPLSTPPLRQRRRVSDSAVASTRSVASTMWGNVSASSSFLLPPPSSSSFLLRLFPPLPYLTRPPPRHRLSLADGPTTGHLTTAAAGQHLTTAAMGQHLGTSSTRTPLGLETADSWVSSPLFPGGPQPRQRKPSVYVDRLAAVEESVKEMNSLLNGEEDTALLTRLISTASSRQSSLEPTTLDIPQTRSTDPDTGSFPEERRVSSSHAPCKPLPQEPLYMECGEGRGRRRGEGGEGDYAEPVDSVGGGEESLYCHPGEGGRRSEGERWSERRGRFSEGNIHYPVREEGRKRKVSLGVVLRKLSRGRLGEAGEKRGGGERLAWVLDRLVGVRGIGSSQTDSSSWEFLSSCSSSPTSTGGREPPSTTGGKELWAGEALYETT